MTVATKGEKGQAYSRRADRALEWQRRDTRAAQDIGELPAVSDPDRKARAAAGFVPFATTYFANTFYKPFSRDHLKVIEKIEAVVLGHETFAVGMPRGGGKTVMCQVAMCWGILTGRHRYAMFIGANAPSGARMMMWLKQTLSKNNLLLEDYPEVCYPIVRLDNEPRRCLGQRYIGEKTNITWGKDRIVLPTIPGSAASEAAIEATSLEASIRGANHALSDGTVIRPSLVLCDDPQTAESARSQGPEGQTTHRMQIIKQDVQGLAGPDSQVGILVPCTVIERGDLADQLLDRKLNPRFRGIKTKRLYAWPANMDTWEQYRELRDVALQHDETPEAAYTFYRERKATCGLRLDETRPCATCNRFKVCMDAGAVVDWIDRLDDPRNQSAVQAALEAFYKYGPAGFAAEFQNEPIQSAEAARLPSAQQICDRANGYGRGVVFARAGHLTAFIDVGEGYLSWLVAAWAMNFTGAVIDYGTWPDQGRTYSKANVRKPLRAAYTGSGVDGAILAALLELIDRLMGRDFPQDDGPPQQIGLCLIDSGHKPDVVHSAIRSCRRGQTVRSSRGRGITAGKTQFDEYRKERCREMGLHWWVPKDSAQSVVQIDTNFWKTFVHSRFATAPGDPGALTLFGKPEDHALFADQVLAEYYSLPRTEQGVSVQEWHQHVGRDNEALDCLVGAAVAASRLGCSVLPGVSSVKRRRRPVAEVVQSGFTPELG